jgi:hypothetical protein
LGIDPENLLELRNKISMEVGKSNWLELRINRHTEHRRTRHVPTLCNCRIDSGMVPVKLFSYKCKFLRLTMVEILGTVPVN